MDEYIKREDAIKAVCDCVPHSCDIASCGYGCAEADALSKLPAADVRPVVRGKWIMNDDSKTVCSLCGNVVAFVSHPDKRWDFGYFCPNCGADMRGGGGNE